MFSSKPEFIESYNSAGAETYKPALFRSLNNEKNMPVRSQDKLGQGRTAFLFLCSRSPWLTVTVTAILISTSLAIAVTRSGAMTTGDSPTSPSKPAWAALSGVWAPPFSYDAGSDAARRVSEDPSWAH